MEILIKKIHARTNLLASGVDIYLAAIIVVHALGKDIPWYLWALLGLEFALSLIVSAGFKAKYGSAVAAS